MATHGPTVENTRALLRETAEAQGVGVSVECGVVEEAFGEVLRARPRRRTGS